MDAIAEFKGSTTARIGRFLESIGLPIRAGEVPNGSFLPGLCIENGGLIIDEERLLYPGDLLHEAGHLAVLPNDARSIQGADAGPDLGNEIAAICWSYAAAVHLQLDPAVVFHAHGYRGASTWFLETFGAGNYPGLPLLQWMGLTADPEHARELGVAPYPHMLRWLRQ
jgi:hypothetical protein